MPEYDGDFELELGLAEEGYHFNLNTGFDQVRRLIAEESANYKFGGVTKTLNYNYKLQFPVYVSSS